ncbi:hypothetical protein [Listeria costaricensis]|uniref:hypothetical protein n=1 Tax=Listeria costaricensis TaxID=2026604 RepID=UPI000C07808B|nr:hypothetical protein [Listeria costaricensis]
MYKRLKVVNKDEFWLGGKEEEDILAWAESLDVDVGDRFKYVGWTDAAGDRYTVAADFEVLPETTSDVLVVKTLLATITPD